jgi:site-specific DNA-methyltransferase (adenine-specific)
VTSIDFRLGDYREVLADVGEVDAVISDPPYGGRTHGGQRHRRADGANTIATVAKESHPIPYRAWGPEDVEEYVGSWAPRCRGWFVAATSHDLVPHYTAALEARGRYVFAPVAAVQIAMNIRLAGDGPSNWTVWLVVARPRSGAFTRWGTLPGAYVGRPFDDGENTVTAGKRGVPGGKPTWLMRALIRDYTRPGDLVCDPCAGAATTLLAAAIEGRRAIGAEVDPETYAKGKARLERGHTPVLPGMEVGR